MTNELAIRIITGDVLGTSDQTHEAIKLAVKALSSADAVPVVRCKDCKHLVSVNKNMIYAVCNKTNKVFHAFKNYSSDTREFFCADGERKDGEE